MSRANWKRFLDDDGDELLTRLHKLEREMLAGLRGIGHFLLRRVPEFFRENWAWIQRQCVYGFRVAIRVGRLAGVVLALLAIAFGPVVACPAIITGLWAALAIAGALWGFDRHAKNRSLKWFARKEAARARS